MKRFCNRVPLFFFYCPGCKDYELQIRSQLVPHSFVLVIFIFVNQSAAMPAAPRRSASPGRDFSLAPTLACGLMNDFKLIGE